MKLYKLPFVMHVPGAKTEDKFMAEIPARVSSSQAQA